MRPSSKEPAMPSFRLSFRVSSFPVLFAGLSLAMLTASDLRACDDVPADPSVALGRGADGLRAGPCVQIVTNTPFASIPTSGLEETAGCYSLVKILGEEPLYVSLQRGVGSNKLFRYVSTDGSVWTKDPSNAVLKPASPGFAGTKCSDLVWESATASSPEKLHVYVSPSNGREIVHAESTDDGVTWSVGTVVFQRGKEFYPDSADAAIAWDRDGVQNPSVIDIERYDPEWVDEHPDERFILAYAGLNSDEGGTAGWNGIGIAYSDSWDGTFERRRFNSVNPKWLGKAFTNKPSVSWQSDLVYRPRLVVGPPNNKLFLFYTAVDSTDRCQKIAYATSGVWGFRWNRGPLDPSSSLPIWEAQHGPYDDKDSYCPDIVAEPDLLNPTTFRLYYLGTTATEGSNTLLAAEANILSLPVPPNATLPVPRPVAVPDDLEPPRLLAAPNPMREGASFHVAPELRQGEGIAELVILDVQGRSVRRLWEGPTSSLPERVEWDGRTEAGRRTAAGAYLFVLRNETGPVESTWISVLR